MTVDSFLCYFIFRVDCYDFSNSKDTLINYKLIGSFLRKWYISHHAQYTSKFDFFDIRRFYFITGQLVSEFVSANNILLSTCSKLYLQVKKIVPFDYDITRYISTIIYQLFTEYFIFVLYQWYQEDLEIKNNGSFEGRDRHYHKNRSEFNRKNCDTNGNVCWDLQNERYYFYRYWTL